MKKLIELNSFELKNSKFLLKKIKKKHVVSPWIENTLKNIKFKKKYKFPIRVVEINLKNDLKLNKPSYLYVIHKKINYFGYKLIPPEIAIYSCLFLKNKKPGKWQRFGTPLRSLIDDDSIPHLPKLGYGLNKTFIETYWAYKKAVFHPHNNFIVIKK